jgi:N-acetylneuraminate lyase
MKFEKMEGLIAATLTPFNDDGSIHLEAIGPYVELLCHNNIRGLYVCGSTGEGMSLSTSERKSVTEEFVRSTSRRIPVIVQVGHNSIAEACELARHAANCGADLVSATCPSYFKISDVETLLDYVQSIAAAAADLPFYYYHIPSLTGSKIDIVEFLERAASRVPNLVGLKYTDTLLHEFQACRAVCDQRFDVVWGCDEMLLGALATGAKAAIGSTYNAVAPLAQSIISAFESGDMETARTSQLTHVRFVRSLLAFPFHAAIKETMGKLGCDLGRSRLPVKQSLTSQQSLSWANQLSSMEFEKWCCRFAPSL